MIVIGGNNNKILAGLVPSLLLRLMTEDKNINIKLSGQFIKQRLAVSSAPR